MSRTVIDILKQTLFNDDCIVCLSNWKEELTFGLSSMTEKPKIFLFKLT